MAKKITELTTADKEQMLSKTIKDAPDNPTQAGWSAEKIKKCFYEGYEILFNWIKRCIEESNTAFDGSTFPIMVTALPTELSNVPDNTLYVLASTNELELHLCKNHALSKIGYGLKQSKDKLDAVIDAVNDLEDGTSVAKKAEKDADGNTIKSSYASSMSITTETGGGNQRLEYYLKSKDNTDLTHTTVQLKEATSSYAGLMNPTEKAKVSNSEQTTNKTTAIDSSSDNTQYPSAKAVYDAIQAVREIASGKNKSISFQSATSSVSSYMYSNYKKADGSSFSTQAELESYINGKTSLDFSSPNVLTWQMHQSNLFWVASDYTILVTNEEFKNYYQLRQGDNIYIVTADIPDRWVRIDNTNKIYFEFLETEKEDLTDFVTKSTEQTITAKKIISSVASFKNASATDAYNIEQTSNGNLTISKDSSIRYYFHGTNGYLYGKSIMCEGSGTYDLGGTGNEWKDAYLKGKIIFGNSSFSGTNPYFYCNEYGDMKLAMPSGLNFSFLSDRTIGNDLTAGADNTYALGTSSKSWKELWAKKIELGNYCNIYAQSDYTFIINPSGGSTYNTGNLHPTSDDAYALGTTNFRWKSISLSDKVDFSNKVSIYNNGDYLIRFAREGHEFLRFQTNGIVPSTYFGELGLGLDTARWENVFVKRSIDLKYASSDNGWKISIASGDTLEFRVNNILTNYINSSGNLFTQVIMPRQNRIYDLGTNDNRWKDIYMSGALNFQASGSSSAWSFQDNGYSQINFNYGGVAYGNLSSSGITTNGLFALVNKTNDIGDYTHWWNDAFVNGRVRLSADNVNCYIEGTNGDIALRSHNGLVKTNSHFRPMSDGALNIGSSSEKWKEVYCNKLVPNKTIFTIVLASQSWISISNTYKNDCFYDSTTGYIHIDCAFECVLTHEVSYQSFWTISDATIRQKLVDKMKVNSSGTGYPFITGLQASYGTISSGIIEQKFDVRLKTTDNEGSMMIAGYIGTSNGTGIRFFGDIYVG